MKKSLNLSPKKHHNCKGAYPSWETESTNEGIWVSWCYGCNRTWYRDTGEEAHLADKKGFTRQVTWWRTPMHDSIKE